MLSARKEPAESTRTALKRQKVQHQDTRDYAEKQTFASFLLRAILMLAQCDRVHLRLVLRLLSLAEALFHV
jgi:hypothetical protein